MSPRIGITESNARKLFYWVIGILAVVALVLIGKAVTPVDSSGQMVFLSPGVAQIANYQRQADQWVAEMSGIETDMQALLNGDTSDLFTQNRDFQAISGRTVSLAAAIDATSTPDTLGGLHDLLTQATAAHQSAATALGQWISEPSDSTKANAQSALNNAASILGQIYNNPWVKIGESTDVPSTR